MRKKIIIDGKETRYSVTDDAHIYNDITGRELKGTYATNEYHSIQLMIDGKQRTFMFHRLVAEAFCENPNGYTIVDHIDRNKHNDVASNLRWVDASTNAKNCSRGGKTLNPPYLGDFTEKQWYPVWKHPNYMISEDNEVVNVKTMKLAILHERHGYYRVSMDDRLHTFHKVLWESVNQQDLPEDLELDHLDGNKKNNHLDNLQSKTHRDNMKNAYANGHKNAVSVKQYTLDGQYLTTYPTIRDAAQAVGALEAAVKDASNRYGTCNGFYWLREDDSKTIEDVLYGWVPEGYTIIPDYPTYCINEQGLVYNKRNKAHTPIRYRADGVTPYVVIQSRRINIETLMNNALKIL